MALVIGNSRLSLRLCLLNPANDARAITRSLEAVGFQVVAGYDLDADAMGNRSNGSRWPPERRGSADLLSGHGIGVDGVNYLLPVDAKLESKTALQREAVSAGKARLSVYRRGNGRVYQPGAA